MIKKDKDMAKVLDPSILVTKMYEVIEAYGLLHLWFWELELIGGEDLDLKDPFPRSHFDGNVE